MSDDDEDIVHRCLNTVKEALYKLKKS